MKHVKKFDKPNTKKPNRQPEVDVQKIVINHSEHQLTLEEKSVLVKRLLFTDAPSKIRKKKIMARIEVVVRNLSTEYADGIDMRHV